MDKSFETDTSERLTRIETKLEDVLKIMGKAEESYIKSIQNELDIKEMKEHSKYLRNTTIGAIITAIVSLIFLLIKSGMGVN